MEKLNKMELMEINGGIAKALKYGLFAVAAGLTFIGSVIYGYIHPVKCS